MSKFGQKGMKMKMRKALIALVAIAGFQPVWAQSGQEMAAMDHGNRSMQGGSAPTNARDPHAYADGNTCLLYTSRCV